MKTLNYEDEKLPQVQISECYRYIKPTDQEWWRANLGMFPDEFTPCNLIKTKAASFARIPTAVDPRRPQRNHNENEFTMRNFPLHEDKIEEIGISMVDMEQYAAIMGEALAAMQWIGEVNGHMSMDINEVHYAFHAIWWRWSEPFMPRPGRNSPLWKAFRDQYPKTGQDLRIFGTGKYGISRLELAHTFIDLVEAEGDKRAEQAR
ncbi:uncharacterized protein N7458_009787 [Penicillium daleae]|uniref:Uncharacterized protein n=1 Tax=Penicillium daleae TaxID=63821 RepID=A0AAD6C0E4_9EURO|nr:uncharacterized protein N7458_009787 [Penicillium daleae]KAJ5438789.1 hypothetical protein N7458_009787 [Penicillium daleae]